MSTRRRRLGSGRVARIVTATGVAVAWAAVALDRVSTGAVAEADPAASVAVGNVVFVPADAPLPAAPAGGLLVVRFDAAPPEALPIPPPVIVRTVVVTEPAPQRPVRVQSRGS